MIISRNNPNIPINKLYPFKIEGSWNQEIDCSFEDLIQLKNQIDKILKEENNAWLYISIMIL